MSEKLPNWADHGLLTLAYWVGYKNSIYSAYPFSEGALVDELLTIISRWKKNDEYLERERAYGQLAKGIEEDKYLDLAVGKKSDDGPYGKRLNIDTITYAIEVKRYTPKRSNTLPNIMRDLEKLHILKTANSNIRCFLIVVSQGEHPQEFISDKFCRKTGNVYSGRKPGLSAKIVNVKKTFNSTRGSRRGNYVILIEVK
ncbi:MAG: hypothetical protein H6581_01895 [Bacteroidia bacterium]|nr:hypothetical protein [Bacteroidia bacterium]